jgi:hypothetical protein
MNKPHIRSIQLLFIERENSQIYQRVVGMSIKMDIALNKRLGNIIVNASDYIKAGRK